MRILGILLLLALTCCFEIDASSCIDECAYKTDACFNTANVCVDECESNEECVKACIREGQLCFTNALRCLADCTEEIEEEF